MRPVVASVLAYYLRLEDLDLDLDLDRRDLDLERLTNWPLELRLGVFLPRCDLRLFDLDFLPPIAIASW